VICLDEMGPESAKSAKSVPGRRVVRTDPDGVRRPRATQEIDYGRRGAGYIFGAFVPATGETLTRPSAGRTTANFVDFVDFLGHAEAWLDPTVARVYAVLDNLSAHRAVDVLLWALAHPRWEFVFQPRYAAYLNLIEPWWKVLRSLALKGRRFETWDEVCRAVADGTRYWNAHRHPFVWGRRQRRRPARPAGIASLPAAA
jgi:transposase